MSTDQFEQLPSIPIGEAPEIHLEQETSRRAKIQRTAAALAVSAVVLLGIPHDANAVIKNGISTRYNGIASPLASGSKQVVFEDIHSAGQLFSDYREYYLENCTYSISNTGFNNRVAQKANSENDNKVALALIKSHQNGQNFAADKVAQKIKDFTLKAPVCTFPEWETSVVIDTDDLDKESKEVRQRTGCTKWSYSWWKDQVRVINPQFFDEGDVINVRWPGDKGYRYPICYLVNIWDKQGLPPTPGYATITSSRIDVLKPFKVS